MDFFAHSSQANDVRSIMASGRRRTSLETGIPQQRYFIFSISTGAAWNTPQVLMARGWQR
jgi:hypothetical protein